MREETKKKLIGVYKRCVSAMSFTDDKCVKEHYRKAKSVIREKIKGVESTLK